MSDQLDLEAVDVDGAIRETADRAAGSTRGALLTKAGVGAGLVLAGGALVAGPASAARTVRSVRSAIPQSDIDILNFALTLEYLEADFYAQAKTSGALTGETLRFANVVSNHEFSHVKFLQKVLGAAAVAKPKFDFKGTTQDMAKFQATADVLENTGVHAYLGQAPNIKTPAVLVGAARILPVEARHAAWIRDIRYSGGTAPASTPAPAAFEDGFSMQKILSIVKGTGFIVG